MIANVSPANSCCEHSLNTLRYADRVKELKGGDKPKATSKEDKLSKELMLARQVGNTKVVAVNQATGQPKPQNPPVNSKPQLKGASNPS